MEAQQGLARGGAEPVEEDRLQHEGQQEPQADGQKKHQVPLTGRAVTVKCGVNQMVEPAGQKDSVQDHTIENGVQVPGEKPPPGGPDLGDGVALGHRGGDGHRLGAGQGLQVLFRVQVGVVLPGLPHLPADPFGTGQLVFVFRQVVQVSAQDLRQGEVPRLDSLDVLQAHPQGPQKPHPQQGGQVLLGIVPVAVGLPLRGEKPLGLVEPDVGPGQSGLLFHLFDRHGCLLLSLVSGGFSASVASP